MQKENLPYYLFTGRAGDLKNKKERAIYRAFEIMPGLLIWLTFALVFYLAIFKPIALSVFILAFAFFWLLKSVYFAILTRISYKKMIRYEKENWIEKLKNLPKEQYTPKNIKDWREVWQLVILPMYNESHEIVNDCLQGLVETTYPLDKTILVLATEERAGEEAQKTAQKIKEQYAHKFGHFLITKHPANIEGELAGKGANETWAAKAAKEQVIDKLNIDYKKILVSSFDIDTVIYPKYFACLTYHFLTAEHPYRSSYQPVPLFINNIWSAPAISRVSAFSSTFWHTLNQERPEKKVTFSSHSMTFKALVEIGFWQTNVVSEDSRVFWQAFLRYDGDYRVVSLYYPIAMDANVAETYWRTMRNIYKQQRRWAYGSADIAYFLFGFLKNKKISFSKKFRYGFNTAEGFYSWGTHALLIAVMGWLALFLGGEEFNTTLFSYNLISVSRILLSVALVGLVTTAYLSILLLPPKPPSYGRHKYLLMVGQWFLVLISLIIFGAFPAIEAQTRLMLGKYMGFWVTPKHRSTKLQIADKKYLS